jgi:hypothetical protein
MRSIISSKAMKQAFMQSPLDKYWHHCPVMRMTICYLLSFQYTGTIQVD